VHTIDPEVEMSVATVTRFEGFTPEAIDFLAELATNNDRAWFTPRKADYERLLKQPLEHLCAALAERFAAGGIPLIADPARSPFRIYRDVRFSKDKSPYKTNIGASFPVSGGGQQDHGGVAGYFHLQPGEIFVGGGMWHPSPARLAALRRTIVGDRQTVHRLLADPAFRDRFGSLHGDSLKRMPQGYDPADPDADLLKLKDAVFSRRLSDSEAFAADLPDRLTEDFAVSVPVLRFLAELPA
jgi:uncharacterized protein (TIGR02453 family)